MPGQLPIGSQFCQGFQQFRQKLKPFLMKNKEF